MKTSSIKTPENDGIVVVRKSFIDLCGDKDAGILLSYLTYWHDVKLNQNSKNSRLNKIAAEHGDIGTQDESLLQYHRNQEIYEQCLGLISIKGIAKARTILKERGFVTEHRNPNKKYAFDKTIFYLLHTVKVNSSISQYDTTSELIGDDESVKKEATITETTTETTSKTNTESNVAPDESVAVADKSDDATPKALSKSMIEATEVASYLSRKLSESIENFKKPTDASLLKWAKDIDLAIRKDNRIKQQLIDAINWIHDDGAGSFWIPNIKSGKKLRQQFDTLTAQRNTSIPKVSARERALEEFGKGKVFIVTKDSEGRQTHICLWGDNTVALYNYKNNAYINKVEAKRIWGLIDKNFDKLVSQFKKKDI